MTYIVVSLTALIIAAVLTVHIRRHLLLSTFTNGPMQWEAEQSVLVANDRSQLGAQPYMQLMSPREMQSEITSKLPLPQGVEERVKATQWRVYKPRTVPSAIVASALRQFLSESGLGSKGYYIYNHKIVEANIGVDDRTHLLRLKVCVYRVGERFATTLSFLVFWQIDDMIAWRHAVEGVIHEQNLVPYQASSSPSAFSPV